MWTNKCTPALHYACKHNKPDLAALLLKHGADPTLQWRGTSPLELTTSPAISFILQSALDKKAMANTTVAPTALSAKAGTWQVRFRPIQKEKHQCR